VKKIDLANIKRICVASRQNAVIGRIKESCWCSRADSYLILSAPYYRSCYCKVIEGFKIVKIKHYVERARKIILISTENLERIQQQLHQHPPTIIAESKENCIADDAGETETMPKALVVPCKYLESLYLDSTRR